MIGKAKSSICYLWLLMMVACGSASTLSTTSAETSGSSSTSEYSTNLEGGAVSAVTLTDNQAVIQLGTVSNSASYVLALYSSSGTTNAFSVGDTDLSAPKALTKTSEDITEDLHQWLREEEKTLDTDAMLPSRPPLLKAAVTTPDVGSQRTFKVLGSFGGTSTTTTVTATLRYKTSHFLAYVDARNASSLSDSDLATLLEKYDSIIEKEQALFGREADVDGDGHFNILFTQAVNELGGSSGGIITGFFYAVDEFSAGVYPQSNQTEIFYTFVPDPEGEFGTAISKSFALSNILPSVLPHEYQHMINFNQHYFVRGGAAESSFLNEGLSHLAEDIYSINDVDYMEETGVENPARVSGYLASTGSLCITCGSSLYQRGGSYLLLRYLYEQAEKGNIENADNGAELIANLLQTTDTGVTNIVKAIYGDTATTTRFNEIMGQFGLAVFMSNTGLSTDARFNFSGINLRTTQDDNRGTVLEGPALTSSDLPLSSTIGGASVSYVVLTGSQINELGGSIPVALSSNAQAGAYLIQTGY